VGVIYKAIGIYVVILFCCQPDPGRPTDDSIIPAITIGGSWSVVWYQDSAYNQQIPPTSWPENDTQGGVVVHIGNPDYNGVVLPDTLWGILYLQDGMQQIRCADDTCQVIGDSIRYLFKDYFDSLEAR
jgi:hypothetical protein